MKKRLRKYKVNIIVKRLLSVALVGTILLSEIPVSELFSMVFKNLSSVLSMDAFAEENVPFGRPEYRKKYNNTDYIHIESWSDLVWYSQSYYDYSLGVYTNPIAHENDVLFINFGQSQGNNYNLNGQNYVPIGNAAKPFQGRIVFSNASAADTFNVPESLFGVISEKVTIKNQEENAVKQIKLTRVGAGNGDPLFAKKVLSDNDNTTHAEWDIVYGKFDDNSTVSCSGVIGEIANGANVELTIENNALQGKSDILSNSSSYDTGKPVDAGFLCGKLGEGATLTANYSGTNSNYNVTSDNGHAGGLVGAMEAGSSLTVTASNPQGSNAWVSASNGYAGGIVGKNDGGTVTITPSSGTTYSVSQIIHGNLGSGGLFGYYAPPSGASAELDISNYLINCKLEQAVSESGMVGGAIGELENAPSTPSGRTGGALTIKGAADGTTTVTSEHVSQTVAQTGNPTGYNANAYGGLIGSYKATDTAYSLTVKDIAITATNTLAASVYGGGIGKIIDPSYVKFEAFKLNSAAGTRSGKFGGLVADSPKGYIYADGSASNPTWTGIIIGSSEIDGFKGGGLVGNLGNGVLGLKGTIDVSNAKPTAFDDNGHLVGTRDNALIYAENGWNYSMSNIKVDNVGSWGDVITFGSTLSKNSVFDSETNNIITLKTVNTSAINNTAAYALASVLFQIDTSKNSFITNVTQLADNVGLTFTADIDLLGTGLRGITRDNGNSRVEYKGIVNGNNKKITFDIKNVGGINRPVYRKRYLGLVAVADGASFSSINFDGSITSENKRTTDKQTDAYVGTAAATIKTSVTASDCNTLSGLSISLTGSVSTIAGRLFGEATGSMDNITVSGGKFDGSITGNSNCTVGGVIGKLAGGASGAVWSFDDVTLKGTVKGVKEIGGLIAVLDGSSAASVKVGHTTAVKTDGITVEGSDAQFMGGLFGYEWKNADVDIDDFKIDDTTSAITTVKQTAAGSTAGLACYASGHWTVNKLDLSQIKMLTSNAASVGIIVNRGKISSDGIYLELPSGYDYKLSFADGSAFKSSGVFDEICAYSAPSSNAIMSNGQGIVSISTYDGSNISSNKLKMGSTANPDSTNTGLTYQAQTSQGAVKNPNSRYYYNLDRIDIGDNPNSKRTFASLSTASEKFLRWGVYRYAASNIQKWFKASNSDTFAFSASDNYDMRGYSWYPINIDSNAVTIKGTFTFYNEEFTETEGAKAAVNSITNRWKPLEADQHYMMHNGIFNNVNASITINGALTLKGTIGALDGTSGTGALVYGKVSGSSSATSDITTISSKDGSISLAGIRIWNLKYDDNGTEKNLDYAPLLINKTGSFVTLKINEVSTTSDYKKTVNSITTTIDAATSLIGRAGASTADGADANDTYITVDFTNIKLDARTAENTPSLNGTNSDNGYNTTKSIFTRATLLERLIGSSGTYTYTKDEDWGSGTPHNVTYGREVGYTASDTTTQYPGEEQWYARSTTSDTQYATSYSAAPANETVTDTFSDFLKYVATVNTAAEITGGGVYYQLKVNHQPTEIIEGCGTYNDPYIIKTPIELVRVSKWINGDDLASANIYALFGDTWCDNKTEHSLYHGSQDGFTKDGESSVSKTQNEMRQYLAAAYYSIEPLGSDDFEIAADSGFLGLGEKTAGFHFCGVIVGNKNTITNKTTYPLIKYSDGSVVKDLTIVADSSYLEFIADNKTITGYINCRNKKENNSLVAYDSANVVSGAVNTYGAVFGQINGGDNIIDNVQVDFTDLKIYMNGDDLYGLPVGGYVGVIINGGLIFRNMKGNIDGLTDNTKIGGRSRTGTGTKLDSDNNAWLFVNPIIGRVINGYAVTESSSYKPREANVTMKNSTGNHDVVKHYSITDIAASGSTLSVNSSDKIITIPDSQAFYIMSLIVNSGMGASGLGYASGTYYMRRHAAYNDVGSIASASTDCQDYNGVASIDSVSSVPYLISKYAGGSAPVGTEDWTVNLVTNGSYDLSDGFRGVGNLFNDNDSYRLNISTLNGYGSTISQNTKYYYFNKDYVDAYKPMKEEIAGLGLINCQVVNCSVNKLILTGSVQCDCIDTSTGNHVIYNGDTTNNYYQLSAAMLFATVKISASPILDSVALQNVNVRGVRHTGGLIGNIPKSNTTLTNTYSLPSYGITVHGAGSTGGMIGRSNEGTIAINNNNAAYSIVEVVSECTSRGGHDYNYGVGGFIGIARSGGSGSITIQNVIVGTEAQNKTWVKCENAEINTGGMVGIMNKCYFTISNCKVYNQSIISQYTSAGLIGYNATPSGDSTISHVSIYCRGELDCEITSSNSFAGGFIGAAKRCVRNVTIQNSNISGYTITGKNYAGGVAGFWGHYTGDVQNKNSKLITNDFKISNCTISSDAYSGGIVGYLNRYEDGKEKGDASSEKDTKKEYYGYNILEENVKVRGSKKGCICGGTYDTDKNIIKIVGFSRHETLEEGETSEMVQNIVGEGSVGAGGYVIFADYLGTASYTESGGTVTPGSNSSAAFSTMTSSTNVTPAAPYVTTSPKKNIAPNSSDVMQYLLSDGVSPLISAAVGKTTEAFAAIYNDILNTNTGYYQVAMAKLDSADEYNAYTSKISSFKTEMGSKLDESIDDFPVLVLDKINKDDMTAFINNYISLLTNTTPLSIVDTNNSTGYNFATTANNPIYSVDIKRVTFNQAGTKIDEISDVDVCLNIRSGNNSQAQFYINSNSTDTAAATAQFTLIDVQFKDPSATGKVAYHLYIPCYVRKLLEYDFDIHIDSGTTYDINSYTSLVENSLVENIGTPTTLEFAFTYLRTAQEWTEAVNGGDSLLSNYPKNLLFDNSTTVASGQQKPNFPAGTTMVLIDTQNHSKAYYLDSLNSNSFTPNGDFRTLNFGSFSSLDSTTFTPVSFNDMLNVSIAVDGSGALVQDNINATVKDTTTGIQYRMATDEEKADGNIQKYKATVTFKNQGDTALSEHYFLTIYTPYSVTDVVYHYVIQANKDLGTNPYPSRITAQSEGHAVHLYTGHIYNNNVYIDSLKVGGVDLYPEITAENNSIEASIHATIGLTSSGEKNVRPTLSSGSPPDIYQSFLIKLNKDGNIGLAAASGVTVENYMIGNSPVTSLNPSWTSSDYTDIQIPNYIEMRNGVPLASSLAEVAENGTLNISAKATIYFDNDNGDITAQFFPESIAHSQNKYTTLIAYSNIASSSANTASSNESASKNYIVSGETEVTPHYYTKLEEKAVLNYDALEIAADASNLPQLGINPNDPKDAKKLPAPIKTVATYNVENCQSAWQAANYLKIEIELKSKYDNYNTALNIFDYLQQSSFTIFDGTISSSNITNTGTTPTKLVYIINKNLLQNYYDDKVYRIPIDFNVYSGSGAANNFEAQNRQYSNYGIFINVSMLQTADSASAVVGTEPEPTNNYVKYTNARIYYEKLNANKNWPTP